MSNFKNFVNGGIDEWNSSEFSSVRHKQVRDTKVGSRIEKVWATDFKRCGSREDFEKYISKYGKYDTNRYVEQAKARIESFDTAEKARIEREKAISRIQQRKAVSGTAESGLSRDKSIIQTWVNVFVWIIIVGSVCLYSYYQYQKEKNETVTDIIITPQTTQQHSQEQYSTNTKSEDKQEHVDSSEGLQLQEILVDCRMCGSTGRCHICFGSARCNVCGGGGQKFSVFYGDEVGEGRMIECGSCGGSGWCPSCEGSGFCFACKGRGKCKLEENY